MARSNIESTTTKQNVGSLIVYLNCSNILKYPNGELIVAVDHNQLRAMASETVDPIDWSYPPPSWAVPPEQPVLHGVNAAYKSQDLLQQPMLGARLRVCQTNALPARSLRVSNRLRIQPHGEEA